MIEKSIEFVRSQIKEYTYLGSNGKFITTPEYPEFAWKELIVNAVAHRDYSIKGTDIQIKMFDDRLCVESPGNLPGIVRLDNIRHVHFSRNPKIAEFLHEYEYVQEFGEGIDRMFNEMKNAGLPEPNYTVESFMLIATIKNQNVGENVGENLSKREKNIIELIVENNAITINELAQKQKVTTRTIERTLNSLKQKGCLIREGSDTQGIWKIINFS